MNLFSKKILLVSLTTALAGSAQIASADSSAQAEIHWDSLSIEFTGSANLNWSGWTPWSSYPGSTSSSANSFDPAESASNSKHAFDFTTSLSSTSTTDFAQSYAERGEDELEAHASSQPSYSPYASYGWGAQNYASASANNSGDFSVTGQGWALITLGWSLSGESSSPWDWSDSASSGVDIYARYDDYNGNNDDRYTSVSNNTAYDGPYDRSGTFAFGIYSDGVNTVYGNLSASAWANSQSVVYEGAPIPSVPVPGAVWMFGSALLGLVGVSRRKASA